MTVPALAGQSFSDASLIPSLGKDRQKFIFSLTANGEEAFDEERRCAADTETESKIGVLMQTV